MFWNQTSPTTSNKSTTAFSLNFVSGADNEIGSYLKSHQDISSILRLYTHYINAIMILKM